MDILAEHDNIKCFQSNFIVTGESSLWEWVAVSLFLRQWILACGSWLPVVVYHMSCISDINNAIYSNGKIIVMK